MGPATVVSVLLLVNIGSETYQGMYIATSLLV